MAEHVTRLARLFAGGLAYGDGEGIVRVVLGCCHGQADDERGFLVEDAWRQHEEWMDVTHFTSNLRIAINPDDVLPVRHPGLMFACRRWFDGYHRSAPSACVGAMYSPP